MRSLIAGNFIPMNDPAGQFIAACWGIFVIVWIIAAFFSKRTVERSNSIFRILWIAAAILLVSFIGRHSGSLWEHLPHDLDITWSDTATVALAAAIITAIGLLICLWARF